MVYPFPDLALVDVIQVTTVFGNLRHAQMLRRSNRAAKQRAHRNREDIPGLHLLEKVRVVVIHVEPCRLVKHLHRCGPLGCWNAGVSARLSWNAPQHVTWPVLEFPVLPSGKHTHDTIQMPFVQLRKAIIYLVLRRHFVGFATWGVPRGNRSAGIDAGTQNIEYLEWLPW
jgi:hypothetical protein